MMSKTWLALTGPSYKNEEGKATDNHLSDIKDYTKIGHIFSLYKNINWPG